MPAFEVATLPEEEVETAEMASSGCSSLLSGAAVLTGLVQGRLLATFSLGVAGGSGLTSVPVSAASSEAEEACCTSAFEGAVVDAEESEAVVGTAVGLGRNCHAWL